MFGQPQIITMVQGFNYKQLTLSLSLNAAAMPLSMAPSTLGLTQKSPQMASLLFLSQRHLFSGAILVAGNALPLQKQPILQKRTAIRTMEMVSEKHKNLLFIP